MSRGIDEVLDAHGDVAPPWARCPEIAFGSIGWRMGYGETWLDRWEAWLAEQPTDRGWRLAYLRRHPPAPRSWATAVARVLGGAREDEEVDEVEPGLLAELEAAGLVGDDVGFGAWLALHGEAPPAPWTAGGAEGSPREAVRYGARELDFWARWCATQRASGGLERWLKTVPPAPESWAGLLAAAVSGVAPATAAEDAFARVAVLLAAHGQPPAPWVVGEPPSSLREDFEAEEAGYADAWSVWVLDRFDDAATWRGYLAGQGPRSEAWSEALERAFPWLAGSPSG